MEGREKREKIYENIKRALHVLSKIADILMYALPLYIIWREVHSAASAPDFGGGIELVFLFLFFPLVFSLFRLFRWILSLFFSLILGIASGVLLSEEGREESEDFRHDDFAGGSTDNNTWEEEETSSSFSGPSSDAGLSSDLLLFGLSLPFSREELQKKYRDAMKRAHPDSGGNEEMAKAINAAKDRLERYAN